MSKDAWQNLGLAALTAATLVSVVWLFASWPPEPPQVAAVQQPAASPTAAPEPTREPPVALLFGDSYFNGAAGVTESQTFGSLAAERLGYQPVVRGAAGTGFVTEFDRTGDYLTQIRGGELDGVASDVELVLVEGGLNDQQADPAQVQAAAERVLAIMERRFDRAKVVLVGPVDPDGELSSTADVTAALADAADASDVTFIDPATWLRGHLATVEDGLHPNAQGHRVLAIRLAAALS